MAKAKRVPKETNVPLVIALVFFVLTTIAFGVMWYMQFSDQQAKDEAVKKAADQVKAANAVARDADLKSKLYRIYMGVDQPEDKASLMAEHKAGDDLAKEVKRLNEKVVEKAGVGDVSKLPAELTVWTVDEKDKLGDPPTKSVFEGLGDLAKKRKDAEDREAAIRKDYTTAIGEIKAAITAIDTLKKTYQDVTAALPKDFDTKLKGEVAKFETRTKLYTQNEAKGREELAKIEEDRAKAERERKRFADQVNDLQQQVKDNVAKLAAKRDVFEYDEPQGKVTRRLADDVVEINLGTDELVRPGLTFTVLPNDFPERGRQSRMRMIRRPDARGMYQNVPVFIPRATIEVTEVLGPHLSRARITEEFDRIRDGAAPGDLLYNAAWRKGVADHVALAGIFDINGDGTDDIESVVRDLTRMGVPVDAYFDLRKRQWVGQVTEQTRYLVRGNFPTNSADDANRDQKTKLIDSLAGAIESGRQKGVQDVSYRDFFPRMGYRVKTDVPLDRINQAAAAYLSGVGSAPDAVPEMK